MSAKPTNASRKFKKTSAKPAKAATARKSGTSKKAAPAKGPKPVDAPFAASILAKARRIVDAYRLVINRDPEDASQYLGSTVEFPEIVGVGPDIESCVRETIELHVSTVAYLLEQGQIPPAPAAEGKRDRQLNVRLTAHEKFILETASQREGYRSVSDFVRAAAVKAAH